LKFDDQIKELQKEGCSTKISFRKKIEMLIKEELEPSSHLIAQELASERRLKFNYMKHKFSRMIRSTKISFRKKIEIRNIVLFFPGLVSVAQKLAS